jgi:hypothetical protein
MYEICFDFNQISANAVNDEFGDNITLYITGYILTFADPIPQNKLIGITPITIEQMKTSLEELGWVTSDLQPNGFRALLNNQTQSISHVEVGDDNSAIPPFHFILPISCSRIYNAACLRCKPCP